MPNKRTPNNPMRRKIASHTVPFLVKALLEKPCSVDDLMETTGFSYESTMSFCRAMCAEGVAHIVDWRSVGSQPVPIYAFGPGKDAERQWTDTEKRMLELFRNDLISRDRKTLATQLGLDPSTVAKVANALDKKGYLIRNPNRKPNDPTTWRRNPRVAFPEFGPTAYHSALAPKRPKPKVAQQSWFSAIAG